MAATDTERPRVLSFGGGVQSSALVALLGRGEYPGAEPQEVWFCDPKNERPQTYEWIEAVIKPYLARLGVPFVTLERDWGSRPADIMAHYRSKRTYPLLSNRQCTIDWKVEVIKRRCLKLGYAASGVEMHLGISTDELHRARTSPVEWQYNRFPLVEARLFRDDCLRLCRETFDAEPVKSGCWWCKYQGAVEWRAVWEQRADGRWALAVEWERDVIAKNGATATFIQTRDHRSLPEWAAMWERGEQLPMFSGQAGACTSGYCMV